MSAVPADSGDRQSAQAWQARARSRAGGAVLYLAPLLGGFSVGAVIGVLLWHLI